jgi:S-adenosylmethionine hydrolase
MNFVSHFYLDGEKGNPYYNFGLILPDLMSIQKRGWKITDKDHLNSISEQDIQIVKGVLKHYELDAIFHQSDYFFQYTKYIKSLFKVTEIETARKRKHFLSHILLELTIDKVIIKKEVDILDDFYRCLDNIEVEKIRELFQKENYMLVNNFCQFFEKFRAKRFLYRYTNNEAIIFVLNKVLERVGLPIFENTEMIERLDESISKTEQYIEKNYSSIWAIRYPENN